MSADSKTPEYTPAGIAGAKVNAVTLSTPVNQCGTWTSVRIEEHAALLHVAEAAEALWKLRDEGMIVWIDPVIGVGEALAALRRARNGGSDGDGQG